MLLMKCCLTSTETAGLAQDGYLNSHTAPHLCHLCLWAFTISLACSVLMYWLCLSIFTRTWKKNRFLLLLLKPLKSGRAMYWRSQATKKKCHASGLLRTEILSHLCYCGSFSLSLFFPFFFLPLFHLSHEEGFACRCTILTLGSLCL